MGRGFLINKVVVLLSNFKDSRIGEKDQGMFHSGMPIIWRLHDIIKQLDVSTVDQDYARQYLLLVVFFKELYTVASDKKRKEHLMMYNKCKEVNTEIKRILQEGNKTVPGKLVDYYTYWDLELRVLMQDLGLGMPKKTDSRYALKG